VQLLIVTQYFWPENFRINDLAEGLVSRGHEVTILTGKPNYPNGTVFTDFTMNPIAYDLYKGVNIIRVPMLARGRGSFRLLLNYVSFALSASIFGPWWLRYKKFDAIFTYEPSPITVGIPAIVLRAIKKTPLAFWVLDLWPETLEAIGVVRSKYILNLVGKLVSFIYRRCDLILAQSKSFIPKIMQYSKKNTHIEYFPSWAEASLSTGNTKLAPEVSRKSCLFKVLFTGNIGEAQDFPAILAAAELLKGYSNIQWLIVGTGRQAAWVQNQIKLRGLETNVLMLGQYPLNRMPSFFLHADALLVSLRDEPVFGMTIPGKVQAYLIAGKPILAMLNGEGADIIERGRAGLTCHAGDYQALSEAVLKLYRMPKQARQAMGENGIKLSNEEFDRDNLLLRLEIWLKDLKLQR